ncbi:MAG: GMC family oxidoreductase [Rhizonema sp. PD38]|nr:GMC family oxidoreductase [Rhizonema sp. PD38]
MTKYEIYDAIIVGSGATGGWAAKTLTEKGMRVLLLEAGSPLFKKNINYAQQRLWQLLKIGNYRGSAINNQIARERQPIQSKCYAWNHCPDFFVDDIDNPYTTPEDKPFIWVRGRQVGGRMVVRAHGRQLYRFSDFQFKAASRDGHGEDWPISYADLVTYYERVEQWIGIRGIVENIPHLPDSVFLPDGKINLGERLLKSALESCKIYDYQVTLGRMAPPKPTIYAAMKTGRLTLRPYAMVSHIIVDEDSGKAKGVAFIDKHTHKSYEAFGKVVMLCASTIESTRILLNSATQQHPTGLGNSSGLLGHYLMDHTSIGINGVVPKPERFLTNLSKKSNLFGTIYIPQFKNIADHHNKFIRGYGIQAGLEWERLQGEQVVKFYFLAFGEMLPRFENQVTINKDLKDAWGIPVPHIECSHSENEREMRIDQLETLKKMADAAGFEVLEEQQELLPPGLSVHECGTARMGDDPKKSVLNKFNQSWDIKNLFVVDGACFVSQGCQNPTLTMMALTARACDYIIYQYQKDNL